VTQRDPAQAALLDRLGIDLPKRMRLGEHDCRLSHTAPDPNFGDFSPKPLICRDVTREFAQVGLAAVSTIFVQSAARLRHHSAFNDWSIWVAAIERRLASLSYLSEMQDQASAGRVQEHDFAFEDGYGISRLHAFYRSCSVTVILRSRMSASNLWSAGRSVEPPE
jgi:hypothetical protein